ncbi:hypothetical protein [Streptomyces sp. NBC_01314]|uniref:hypothetical protein n=1 Tax=Streptomyces sp. NBC_01314 TaxID=2903821 RepID=UPI00308F26DC|nr:hypothetical protein OG622_28905 [Streptomyces sp. NBC_01314]
MRGEAGLLGGDPGPAGAQELTDLGAAVHAPTVRRTLPLFLLERGTARPPEEQALHYDVEPYNIHTTVVEPGFFRTELLVDASTTWPEPTIDDYAERTTATITAWKSMNGQQSGDPAKLARALLTLTDQDKPLQRFVAGADADAIQGVEAKARELLAQAEASRELGANLAHDDTNT